MVTDIQLDADQPCPDPRCNDNLGAMPIPQCVSAVRWAERSMEAESVLKEMADRFDGIDNGTCRVCTGGFRLYDTKGNPQACDNKNCLSHRIAAVLNPITQDTGGPQITTVPDESSLQPSPDSE